MALDFNEARLIVEAAKKRGAIRLADEPETPAQPEPTPGNPGILRDPRDSLLPDWLRGDTSQDSRRGGR